MSVHHSVILIQESNKETNKKISVMSHKLKILQQVNEVARHVNAQKEIQTGQRVVGVCRETDGQTDRKRDRWLLKSGFYRMEKQTNR